MLFVRFRSGEFSSRMLGVGHLISNSYSSLADKTKHVPCPSHLSYRVGPSASSCNFFASQELTNDLCHYNPAEVRYVCVCVCVSTCMDVQIATQTHIPYRQLVTCIQQVPGLNLTWNTGYEDRNIE